MGDIADFDEKQFGPDDEKCSLIMNEETKQSDNKTTNPTCPLCGSEVTITVKTREDSFFKVMTTFYCKDTLNCNFVHNYFFGLDEALKRFTPRLETAWEMFRRLSEPKTKGSFHVKLCEYFKMSYIDCAVEELQLLPEQEAITIMQQIEKGLMNE